MKKRQEYKIKDIAKANPPALQQIQTIEKDPAIFACYVCYSAVVIKNPRFIKRSGYTVAAGYCPHCGNYLEKVVK